MNPRGLCPFFISGNMSNYLLLRSNKESGPYTLDQIRAIGLKPYDLIWIEGRSAAWRYPSEVEEFKSFAPIVEEQPYDRFYKRNPVKSQPLMEVSEQLTAASAPVEQNRTSIYATRPQVAEKIVHEKEPLLQTSHSQKIFEPVIPAVEKVAVPITVIHQIPERAEMDEKFSQPLDDIKRKYVEQVLNRKKESLQLRQLATIAAMVFGLILLFAGGIFVGITISKRGISSTTKDMVKEEPGAGSQQADYHPHPIPVSSTIPDQASEKPAVENDDYSQFLAEMNKKDPKETEKKQTKPAAERIPAVSNVIKNNTGSDSTTSGLNVTPRLAVHRTDALFNKEAVKNNIGDYVHLSSNKYYVGTFGGISDIEITVSNRSLYSLDMVAAEIQYIQANKKIFKTETVYFKNVGPGSSIMQEAPKSSRGVKVEYRITSINSKELGLPNLGM